MSMIIYHIVNMIIRTNLPIETFIQFPHDQITIILIFH